MRGGVRYIGEGRGQVYRYIIVSYRDQSKNVTPRNIAKRFDLVTPVGLDVVDFILHCTSNQALSKTAATIKRP